MEREVVTNRNIFGKSIQKIAQKMIILNLGSGNPIPESLRGYKQILLSKRYFALDYCKENSPHIVGDIQQLPLKSKCADALICISVLEHVPNPHQAVRQIYRVLQTQGSFYGYVPFLFPYHCGEGWKDYCRFTIDGLFWLFKDFTKVIIQPALEGYAGVTLRFMGGFISPFQKWLLVFRCFLHLALKMILSLIFKIRRKDDVKARVEQWLLVRNTTGYNIYAEK